MYAIRSYYASVRQAELATLDFLSHWVEAGSSPMCGNSICQDRRFLHRLMPELEAWFHYRNLDVSNALKDIERQAHGGTIVKLRAFVARNNFV